MKNEKYSSSSPVDKLGHIDGRTDGQTDGRNYNTPLALEPRVKTDIIRISSG